MFSVITFYSLGADLLLTTVKGRSVLHTAACSDAANCLKLFLKISFEQEKAVCRFSYPISLSGIMILNFPIF